VTARDCWRSSQSVRHVSRETRRGDRRRDLALTLVAWLASSALSIAAGQAAVAPSTILDGVYTEAQAERGLRAYADNCSRCHRDNLQGNPEALGLTGTRFIDAWREDALFNLFDFIATRMPRQPRITLPPPVYADIVAFILRFNAYPPGDQELTPERMKDIRFVDKSGPQPIPNLSLVRVVGCLTPASRDTWILTRATEPSRERDGGTITGEELQTSAGTTLGTGSFQLQNLDYVDDFSAAAASGHKVQVKGALNQRPGGDRISVTSVASTGSRCP
jgi:mono/diheme cytochrome c family protein